ncbi:hypothetical protein K450DRAFT_255413 [Umbelopsis ramanniana AG]|uniref:Uncharacterized protein n=1 Tax=Umbelopsis ramanniana AG TaxID=1314678 RepID=A0AAD5HAC4_UMBRA|nr:uncharacterized protein K450DRAFT_255413 [Umbelopsis ramanniana AG]KAI8576752.1 hypothetical protein K450DRAFT_255413 [Umbelopsis ramanniana AG]
MEMLLALCAIHSFLIFYPAVCRVSLWLFLCESLQPPPIPFICPNIYVSIHLFVRRLN